jgi:hypothetical protein
MYDYSPVNITVHRCRIHLGTVPFLVGLLTVLMHSAMAQRAGYWLDTVQVVNRVQPALTVGPAIWKTDSTAQTAFRLINTQLCYQFGQLPSFTGSLLVNNLTQSVYQTIENKAMPGLNGRLQLAYAFH